MAAERRRRRVLPSDVSRAPDAKPIAPTVAALPPSVRSIKYDAATGATTISLHASVNGQIAWWVLTATELRAVYLALGRCVEESARVVLDVDAT